MKPDNGMPRLATLFRRRCAINLTLVAMIAAVLIAGGGCDQNTESRVSQPPDQKVNTPTDGGNQATQGSKVTHVYGNYFPRGLGFDDADGIPLGEDGRYPAVTEGYSDNGVALADGKGGYVFLSSIEIVTGGTTPTGASVTGSGSGSQTTSATGSQTPTQTVTPEISAAMPIGVAMPGGVNDLQATATGRGTSSPQQTNTNTISLAQFAGAAKDNPEAARLIVDRLFPPQADAEMQPADQPQATPPPTVPPTGN